MDINNQMMDINLRSWQKFVFWQFETYQATKESKNVVLGVGSEIFLFKVLLNTGVIARKWVLDVFPTLVGVKR